jgi:hypothetical protein
MTKQRSTSVLTPMSKFILGCTAALALGCSSTATSDAASSSQAVTFHRDVEPILQRSCQGCHAPGGIAPFPLLTYADARPYADAIVQQTTAKLMPPWHAENTSECTTPFGWKDDIRLSDAEIATLTTWRDEKAPEGDPNDAPPPIAPITGLAGVALELEPAGPFSVQPNADEFRCFVLDPKLAADSFVNGIFVIPSNRAVVHHVLLFADAKGESLAKVDSSGSYDCFGGPELTDPDLLMAWTPGGVPLEYPPNVAAPLTAGSQLVMQVHYHPHSTSDVEQDTTKIQLRFSDSAPEYRAVTRLIGNFRTQAANGDGLLPGPDDPASGPKFLIPAGASAHTETMRWTYRALRSGGLAPLLYGIGGHMHYVGSDEKIVAQHGDGSSTCLLQIPHWDFDWQRRYDYDAPLEQLPVLSPGDRLEIRCTYDNTLNNAQLAGSLLAQGKTATSDVALGETSLDEMCLANVTALYPAGL